MKNLLRFFLMTFLAAPAFAAGTSTGTVGFLLVNLNNTLIFSAGTPTGQPGCSIGGQWAVDLNVAKGKSIYALLLAAAAQGSSVTVNGSGACSDIGDRESVLYLFAYP